MGLDAVDTCKFVAKATVPRFQRLRVKNTFDSIKYQFSANERR
jgi:hypothetical protein